MSSYHPIAFCAASDLISRAAIPNRLAALHARATTVMQRHRERPWRYLREHLWQLAPVRLVVGLLAAGLLVVIGPCLALFLMIFAAGLVTTAIDFLPSLGQAGLATAGSLIDGLAAAGAFLTQPSAAPGGLRDDLLVIGAGLFGFIFIGIAMLVVMVRCGRPV